MPINPLYEPLSEQTYPGQKAIDAIRNFLVHGNDIMPTNEDAGQQATPYIPGGLTPDIVNAVRGARPQTRIPVQQPIERATPYIPGGLTPDIINAVKSARPQSTLQVQAPTSQLESPAMVEMAKLEPMTQPAAILQPQDIEPIQEPITGQIQLENRFRDTTLGKKAHEMGGDPRLMYAALAQFAGEFGNLAGKATPSSAPAFLEAQLGMEKDTKDEAMKREELALRYASKPQDPKSALQMQLLQAQTDSLKNKMRVDQEMNDPKSERSQAWRRGIEVYMQKSLNAPGWKADARLSAADIKPWLSPLQFGIGQVGMNQRAIEAAGAQLAEKKQTQDFQAEQAKLTRDFQAQQNALNRKAQGERQATAIAAKPGKKENIPGEPEVLIPGWKKTQNVPIREVELSSARDITAQVPPVISQIRQLIGYIRDVGSYENPYSEKGRRMQSLATGIQLQLKSPAFMNLGVLAGPDLALLQTQIPDTGAMKNSMQGEAFVGQLNDVIGRLESGVASKMRSMGFEKETAREPQGTHTGPRGNRLWKP